MEVHKPPEGDGVDGFQVRVVAEVQLLQFGEPVEGPGLDEADVVGVDPQDGHVAAGGEAGGPHQGYPVVVQEDALALDGDLRGDGCQPLLLAADGDLGFTVAYTRPRAGLHF